MTVWDFYWTVRRCSHFARGRKSAAYVLWLVLKNARRHGTQP